MSIILVAEVDDCHDFAVSFETRCKLQDSNGCANHCFAICQCHRFGAFVAHGQFRTRVLRLSFSLFSEQWLLSLLPCPLLSFQFLKFKMLQLPKSFVETADAQEEAPVAEEPATEENTEEHRQFTTPLQLRWLQQRQCSTRSTAPPTSGMVWITLLWKL